MNTEIETLNASKQGYRAGFRSSEAQATVIVGPQPPHTPNISISSDFECSDFEWFNVPLLKTNKCCLGIGLVTRGLGLLTTSLITTSTGFRL